MVTNQWEVWLVYPGSLGTSHYLCTFKSRVRATGFAFLQQIKYFFSNKKYNGTIIVVPNTFMRGTADDYYRNLTQGLDTDDYFDF